MKKVLSFMFFALLNFGVAVASELNVKSNLESGEYNFPIEINLISNDKEAKIFYYTDGKGRIDDIKEFKNPILLKEDTTIDFYATKKNLDTLIQTSTYTFNYSKDIDISEKNGKIIIKNNSDDIQNIGYWKVKANNLNYEITPNTFIDINKNYNIDYNLTNNEKITLFSPDNKIVKDFIYKKVDISTKIVKEKNQTNEEILNGTKNALEEINHNLVTNQLSGVLNDNKNKETKESSGFILNDSLKTSIIDNKNSEKENKSNNIYVILGIIVLITIYNIGLFSIKSKKNIKMQTEINKIGKK